MATGGGLAQTDLAAHGLNQFRRIVTHAVTHAALWKQYLAELLEKSAH